MLMKCKQSIAILAVLSLVACGGGGGDNYAVGNGNNSESGSTDTNTEGSNSGSGEAENTDARIVDLEVNASSRQLGTSKDTLPVVISASAKDANNNTIRDAEISFAVDNRATINPDEGNNGSVDENGVASAGNAIKTAKLTPGLSNPENRTVTVTVTAGEQVRTLEVEISGTTLALEGAERILLNTPARFVARLQDSEAMGIPNQVVAVSSSNGNQIEAVTERGFATDASGEVAFEVTALNSGTDVITVSALGAEFSQDIDVSGDEFALSSANAEIKVNTEETINLVWKSDGIAQANRTIELTATRGEVPASVQTNLSGEASFTLSSSTAGVTNISARDPESGLVATLEREFVATVPHYLSVMSERGGLAPEGHAVIYVLVRDIDDNPVKNQIVNFKLQDTVNGELNNSTATTNSVGKASVIYTAGNASSAKDGVVIDAELQSNPAIRDRITLTVGDQALRIVLGYDENLAEDGVFYSKPFGVLVTDSAGNPVANQSVDFELLPIAYYKGGMICLEESWEPRLTTGCFDTDGDGLNDTCNYVDPLPCPSEDLNANHKMDDGEDFNNNGTLEPGNDATVNASVVTDEQGRATVDVRYPQSHALWSRVRLVARTAVSGTEYEEVVEFDLPILASDVSGCEISAPNQYSPYGQATSCANPN